MSTDVPKFKIGDIVVVLNEDDPDYKHFIGKTGTIEEVSTAPWVNFENRRVCFAETKLELASIFNSPLYEALK